MLVEERIENGILIRTMKAELSDLSTSEQKTIWTGVCQNCEYYEDPICTFAYCKCIAQTLMTYSNSKCPTNKW